MNTVDIHTSHRVCKLSLVLHEETYGFTKQASVESEINVGYNKVIGDRRRIRPFSP